MSIFSPFVQNEKKIHKHNKIVTKWLESCSSHSIEIDRSVLVIDIRSTGWIPATWWCTSKKSKIIFFIPTSSFSPKIFKFLDFFFRKFFFSNYAIDHLRASLTASDTTDVKSELYDLRVKPTRADQGHFYTRKNKIPKFINKIK